MARAVRRLIGAGCFATVLAIAAGSAAQTYRVPEEPYAPSYNYIKAGDGGWAGSLNHVGFAPNLDITSLEAAIEKQASEAHFHVVLFVLPAIKDGWPWIFSLSLGAVWY